MDEGLYVGRAGGQWAARAHCDEARQCDVSRKDFVEEVLVGIIVPIQRIEILDHRCAVGSVGLVESLLGVLSFDGRGSLGVLLLLLGSVDFSGVCCCFSLWMLLLLVVVVVTAS